MKPEREDVQPQHGSSFTCLDVDLPDFDHNYHYHPEIELTWIIGNHGERLMGDSMEHYEDGDLVLIGPNLPHQYRNWKSGRARSKVIQFKPDLFGQQFFALSEFNEIEHLLSDAARGIHFSESTSATIRRRMNKLFKTSTGPTRIMILIDILHILSQDNQRRQLASIAYAEPMKHQKIERLQRVLNFLETKWQEPVTLKEASQVAALHPQSMSRFFQQHLGMTFQDYLIRLRLSRAAQQLLETNRTIADIAFHCGFNNLANFNRHFQTVYQQTPSLYRKKR